MPQPQTLWVTQLEAAHYLQVSQRTLTRWRSDNFFHPQIHYRRATPSPRSKVLYNLEKCESTISKATRRNFAVIEQPITPNKSIKDRI